MRKKTLFSLIATLFFIQLPPLSSLTIDTSKNFQSESLEFGKKSPIHPLASLLFFSQELEFSLKNGKRVTDIDLPFSPAEVALLWEKAFDLSDEKDVIQRAFLQYELLQDLIASEGLPEKSQSLKLASSLAMTLRKLWHAATEAEEATFEKALSQSLRSQKATGDPNLDSNPYIIDEAKKAIAHYLIPLHHPMRKILNSLFSRDRITTDKTTFTEAGFKIIAEGRRSFICVANHPKMPHYLVKIYLDTVLSKKQHKESWEWLVRRCVGAKKIRKIIRHRKLQYFVAADKWIYCLPPEPSPINDGQHIRHPALLLVTDMNLVPSKLNKYAWRHYITEKHLDELYTIISRAKGSSYRPDNIAYTYENRFAFIDTEYPSRGPDYKSIRKYLNPTLLIYWDSLVRNGGP